MSMKDINVRSTIQRGKKTRPFRLMEIEVLGRKGGKKEKNK